MEQIAFNLEVLFLKRYLEVEEKHIENVNNIHKVTLVCVTKTVYS